MSERDKRQDQMADINVSEDDSARDMSESQSDSSYTTDTLVGTILDGRFLIERLLGRGGLGTVYQALHRETDRRVAIKILLPHQSQQEKNVRRFQHEARILHRLEHPNIAQVYGFGVTNDGSVYLTLEYLHGPNLKELIGPEGLGTDEIIYFFKQIALAVAYAHGRGVVHRDLKPHNVMIVSREKALHKDVKVLDFGISKLLVADDLDYQKLTSTGVILGTPAYMSPEQATTALPDFRSDIYSFGCMLYEALSGEPPFQKESYPELISAHLKEAPPPIKIEAGDTARKALAKLAAKCLEKEPHDRFQSMNRIIELLDEIEEEGDADVEQLVPTNKSTRSFRVPLRMVATILVALLVAVTLAQILLSTTYPPPPSPDDLQQPQNELGFKEEAQRLRNEAGLAAEANDYPRCNKLLKQAAENYQRAFEKSRGIAAQRTNLYEQASCLGYASMEEKDLREAARLYRQCADLDKTLEQQAKTTDKKYELRRDQADALLKSASIRLFCVSDLQGARVDAERALKIDQGDGKHTLASAWPLQMISRYNRQPKAAAGYADTVLVYLQQHPYKVKRPRELLLYCGDAVVDYVSAGYSVKDAKARVYSKVSELLAEDQFTEVKPWIETRFPDGCEASITPAYKQESLGYPGVIPK